LLAASGIGIDESGTPLTAEARFPLLNDNIPR